MHWRHARDSKGLVKDHVDGGSVFPVRVMANTGLWV